MSVRADVYMRTRSEVVFVIAGVGASCGKQKNEFLDT